MLLRKCFVWLLWGIFCSVRVGAQRVYTSNSVLATGNWYKLSVEGPGIYKVDIPFLNSLGINTGSLASGSVKIYGNGGAMLPEANSTPRPDDLSECAIQVADGGDGVLNGNDYLVFFAPGPHQWFPDPANQQFVHRKNIYTDQSFYFLTVGTNGKRIALAPLVGSPVSSVSTFSERYFHETDAVNFLGSSKEWYGEEFANAPGKLLSRDFAIHIPHLTANAALHIKSDLVSRSVGAASRFDLRINNQAAGQFVINAVGGGAYDLFARSVTTRASGNNPAGSITVSYTYTPGSFNAQGWLNWFELFTRRNISLNGLNQLFFRDWQSVGTSATEFAITGATAATQVWDITDAQTPVRMQGNFSAGEFRFVNHSQTLREYVAFNPLNFPVPKAEGRISNQNLHAASPADFIIIAHPSFIQQALRLAQLHQQKDNLRTVTVSTEQVWNEFAGGNPDPVALRDFVKMYFDKYGSNSANRPRYLLLFGDASYDFKNRIAVNTNLVPGWQNDLSLDPLSTYTSDDFFGFLDDHEDINSGLVTNLLDIGIGRIPAKNVTEAKNYVDKLENYLKPESLGPWRNTLTFIADDEDNNLHLNDAEIITATAAGAGPVFNQQKIYLDAYRQESGPGGDRYPEVNQLSNSQLFAGTLIWNYNGHGGASRLAEETILDQQIADSWSNPYRLPLFITATCDFAPYDNPAIASIGENILLRPRTGGIALMTTTRVVFAFSNRVMNNNYLQFALEPDANGVYKTLGEAVQTAKNYTYQTFADIANNRKFTLLGDPALRLAFPVLKVNTTRINGIPVSTTDTLSATEKITVEGEVTDAQGNLLQNFNGNAYATVYDKPFTVQTLANDGGSTVAPFQSQTSVLFKGKSTVTSGRFSFTFKVPKDINYQFGNGKMSLYAENGLQDGNGAFTGFIVGGAAATAHNDNAGPEIKLFLNDDLFVSGGITNQNPVLLVKLTDSSGINTTGTGTGHAMAAVLDNDPQQYFVLNDFYQAEANSYQQGTVRFQLPVLAPGPHSIKVKAWDGLNNSNEAVIEFVVANDEGLKISRVLNYPNPFSSSTQFWFEHNKPGQPLRVDLQIMTISGRVVKTFSEWITTEGTRSAELIWDGKDSRGDKLGRGVYLYKLKVTAPGGKKKEVVEKLVIL